MAQQPSKQVHVGCAGWSLPSAAADRFPRDGSHLNRYAGKLPAVEINSSFYRSHRAATYERWAGAVPDGFRFAVKVPQRVTHELRLREVEEPLNDFLGECLHLGPKLGPLLLQLPPSLAFDLLLVGRFWRQLRDRFDGDVVCEPRHPSWFEEPAERMLLDYSIARVAADPAPVPAAAFPGGDSGVVYFRLHGSPRRYYSAYDRGYLEQLANQLMERAECGAEAWCIFDNTAEGSATVNALELLALLANTSASLVWKSAALFSLFM